MANAGRVRAERRAARVAQMALVGNGAPRRSVSPAANAATDPMAHEQQDSLLPHSVWHDGCTATLSPTPTTASSTHARRGPANAQATLLKVSELLHYRPVNAAGKAPAPSCSLLPPPSQAGDVAHSTPPPPPRRGVDPEPRHSAPPHDPRCGAPARDEASCKVVQRPQANARALPAPQRQYQGPAPPELVARGRQDRAPPVHAAPPSAVGCRAFTPELRRIVCLGKFKSDLPPRYDATPTPVSSSNSTR
nr:atherin-like [Aegilops tauschii subsp. strangulata]